MRGKVDKLAWLLLAAWLVSSSGAVSSAHAQPSEVQAARAAYLRATAAAEELRWSDALQDFREAYTLSGAPPALLNVGLALRALGRYVEARDTFELLLGAEPEYAREQNVSELLDHARTQIAQISVEGLAGSNQIRLNGRPVAPDAAYSAHRDRLDRAIVIVPIGHRDQGRSEATLVRQVVEVSAWRFLPAFDGSGPSA